VAVRLVPLENKNKEEMRKVFDLVLFPKMEWVSEERKNELVEDAFKQQTYLQLCESLANSDIDINAIKVKVTVC
jgi:hypothetical protein